MISDLCKIFAISTLIAISACRSNGTEESSQNLTKIHYPNFEELFLEEYARPFKSGDIDSWIKLFADDAVALHNRREADISVSVNDVSVSVMVSPHVSIIEHLYRGDLIIRSQKQGMESIFINKS